MIYEFRAALIIRVELPENATVASMIEAAEGIACEIEADISGSYPAAFVQKNGCVEVNYIGKR